VYKLQFFTFIFNNGFNLLVVNVYLPCFESELDYKLALLDCLEYIQNCSVCIAYDGMILLGDFDFECKDGAVGYKILQNLLCDYNLKCCENLLMGLLTTHTSKILLVDIQLLITCLLMKNCIVVL